MIKVEYTDDGCSLFQCPTCKGKVESRSDAREWKVCPLCGTSANGIVVVFCRQYDCETGTTRETVENVFRGYTAQEAEAASEEIQKFFTRFESEEVSFRFHITDSEYFSDFKRNIEQGELQDRMEQAEAEAGWDANP